MNTMTTPPIITLQPGAMSFADLRRVWLAPTPVALSGDCAAAGSHEICPRMVCRRLKSVCGDNCIRKAARFAAVRARSNAAERNCASRKRW